MEFFLFLLVLIGGLLIALKVRYEATNTYANKRKQKKQVPGAEKEWAAKSKDRIEPTVTLELEPLDLEPAKPKSSTVSDLMRSKPVEHEIKPDYKADYYLTARLLTPPELKYMKVLMEAVNGRYYIMSKVRMADVIVARKKRDHYKHFNKVNRKHFDFVLCDTENFKPVVAIELDDSSHQRRDRIERDAFVNALCEGLGLPLIRQPTRRQYKVLDIRQAIKKAEHLFTCPNS